MGRHRAVLRLLIATLAAHVTIDPPEARKGRFVRLAFRVPTERDDAATTSFSVRLPAEHPIKFVSVRPDPRWTYQVETAPLDEPFSHGDEQITEAVSTITWTGGQIRPGEFDEFVVSLGPLPGDADRLQFLSTQTYDDAEVVHFAGERSGHPIPSLTLVDPEDLHQRDHVGRARSTTGTPTGSTTSHDAVETAQRRATAGLVVGAVGLAVALVAARRNRRHRPA